MQKEQHRYQACREPSGVHLLGQSGPTVRWHSPGGKARGYYGAQRKIPMPTSSCPERARYHLLSDHKQDQVCLPLGLETALEYHILQPLAFPSFCHHSWLSSVRNLLPVVTLQLLTPMLIPRPSRSSLPCTTASQPMWQQGLD